MLLEMIQNGINMGVIKEVARELIKEYRKTGDLAKLLTKVSHQSSWYGRFGATNREIFIEELIKVVKEKERNQWKKLKE